MYMVVLTFRPTRTRPYTGTILDLVNDMFVPRTELAAVSYGEAAAQEAGQKIIERLRDDCPHYGDVLYQFTKAWSTWKEYLPVVWDEAIEERTEILRGVAEGKPLPDTVYIILDVNSYSAWGRKGKSDYTVYEPYRVYSTEEGASAAVRERINPPGCTVVSRPLLGIPAAAAA